jgi:ATP-dependent Clp protease ATP-binding subunit ClpX
MASELADLDPAKLLEHLNREVYGQKWAKEKLTDALAWNQQRLRLIRQGVPTSDLPAKANVLLIGPTGCGKTFLTSTAARFCKLPYFYTRADGYSAPGYTGDNVDSMVAKLLEAAGDSVFAAERGIIFIDEIDKIRRKNFGGHDDVGGVSVQQGLLTILEGTTISCGLNSVDTSGITFVAGGAFSSISEGIGPDGQRQFEAAELRDFGLLPEFIGRFPLRVGLAPLTAADLRKLLLECQSSTLWRTKNVFQMHGIEFAVDNAVIDSIIERAQRMGTGARSLDETLKDRCLGLMARVTDLQRRSVRRVLVREGEIVEEKGTRIFERAERPRTDPLPRTSERAVPLDSRDARPPGPRDNPPPPPIPGIPRAAAPTGKEMERQSPMTPKAWVTVALVFVLVALGLGAYRSSSTGAGGPRSDRPPSERRVSGEETPRLWDEIQRARIPK